MRHRVTLAFLPLAFALIMAACDPPSTPPTPSFTVSPASGAAPLSVQFNDTSASGSSPISAWQWTFGDGGTSTDRNPVHVYQSQGTFDVTLTVTTAVGSRGITRNAVVTVSTPTLPTARFDAAPTTGIAPLAVQFTDTSLQGSQPITAWEWNFGDGNSSTARNPSHAYADPGTYTVSLRVTTAVGDDTSSRANLVTVAAPGADPAITLARSAANAGVFTPGGTLDITLTMTITAGAPLTALGIRETLPDGWSFVEIVSGANPPPTIQPVGDTGDLEFSWINPPPFPSTFTYRVSVPANASAEEVLSGLALFRTTGTELQSNTVITTLTRAGD